MLHIKEESPKTILQRKIYRAETDISLMSSKNRNDPQLTQKAQELNDLKREYKDITGESYKHTFKSSSSGLNFLSAKRTSSKEAEINSTITATP